VEHIIAVWRSGKETMAHGKDPGVVFWRYLLAALDAEYREFFQGIGSFPFRARVQRVDGGRGRRSDPELAMRNKVLAQFVKQEIDRGSKYEWAIVDVVEALGKFKQEEGWRGRLPKLTTVREAYRQAKSAASK
jgi:hypothetical protein